MNMPSSLALSPSKLLQSRLGILLLALVVVAVGGGVYLLTLNRERPAVLPSPGTSPAAQALPRPGMLPGNAPGTAGSVRRLSGPHELYGPPAPEWALTPVPTATVGLVYGPPAPDWALRQAPPVASAPATAAPAAGVQAPGATAAAPATGAVAKAGTALPAPATAAPAVPTAGEVPKSIDASVLFAREQFTYVSEGRRDPFQSLIDGKFQGQGNESGLVDVGDIHLVGIMWGSSDKFALVEDSRGHGYVLRVGDPVLNGYISGISKSDLQIVQNAFGDSQTLSIHLQPKEGDKNANRN